MLFCVKTPISKLYVFGIALLLAATLAGCGSSGGGTTKKPDPPTMPEPTPQEQCEAAGGRWNADETCTSAEDLEAERVAMVAAVTKAAGTKETAIAAEAAQANDAGLGGSAADGTAITTYSIAISRDADGTKVMITDSALAGADDPKFMQAEDLGGGSTMHARAMEADADGNVVEEVVIVSTDIEAPRPTAFATVAGQALNARDLDDSVDADGDGDATNDFTALTVDGTSTTVVAGVMASRFESSTQAQLTFAFDDASTTDEDEADEVAGTYNGAMGTYRCDGASDCTVDINAMGEISAMSAGWVFIPAADSMSSVPDSDYLHYGFWLKNTTDKDGVVTYNEVETFAGSSLPVATNTVNGSASYKGGATGVYVRNVYNPDRTLDTATSGHFTADVSIMAYFGGDDVAVSKQNSIEGTIDNFVLSGGEDTGSWSVEVEADISGAILDGGTAKGGGAGDGSITGTFHGDDSVDVNGTATPIGHKVLVGEFNAEFTNGSVAGAYGARRE